MDPEVPLDVPEVNAHSNFLSTRKRHHRKPELLHHSSDGTLKPLAVKYGLKRVIYSTYQAVSGAGMGGYSDLENGLKGEAPKKFPHPHRGQRFAADRCCSSTRATQRRAEDDRRNEKIS
jgi:aspartate-semialdehyde dehydrogenase